MKDKRIFLDKYILQKDMRIRMPKAILENTGAIKGDTMFEIYYDLEEDAIVLKRERNDEKR